MRKYDTFLIAIKEPKRDADFVEIAREALFDPDTRLSELSSMLEEWYIHELIDLNLFNDLVISLSKQQKLLPLIDDITNLFKQIYVESNETIKLIIGLIISDKGEERLLGRKLFDQMNPSVDKVQILDYTEESQIKFAISLTLDYGNPEQRCKHICNLFNSQSTFVRRYLIKVISAYTLNYFGLFKANIDNGNLNESEELKKYKEFLHALDKRFELSHHAIEFRSEYLFPICFDIAKRSEKEYYENLLQTYGSLNKSHIREFFKPITLGRGGGFRRAGVVTPLAKITASTVAPMMLASETPLEQRKTLDILLRDWKIKDADNE